MKSARRTMADMFCETYVVEHGGYLLMLPKLLEDTPVRDHARLFRGGRPQCLTEHEGIPAYKVRGRFVGALRRCGNNPRALYAELYRLFSEEAIKTLFTMPNVWVLRHNQEARRRRAEEVSNENRMKKLDRAGFALHRQCEARTANRTAGRAAREERELGR